MSGTGNASDPVGTVRGSVNHIDIFLGGEVFQ
jgi:hypothetical protein